jgi:hypothetical protein
MPQPIEHPTLAVGTTLWARYRGHLYHCEVVEVAVLPKGLKRADAPTDPAGGPDPRLVTERRYRLYEMLAGWSGSRDFTSLSGVGSAVRDGKATNGWTFWQVGEPPAAAAPIPPARRTKPAAGAGQGHAAPKPTGGRRRRAQSETEPSPTRPIVAQTDGSFECGECGTGFASHAAAEAHLSEVHPA